MKWNLVGKVEDQWITDDPSKFDSNDPRCKLSRFNTGCPTGCYYPSKGNLFQANVKGMANLEFLGIYDSPYIAGLYGMENLEKLIYLEIVRSHNSSGYGTFIEYPLVASVDEFVPFYSYPPNLLYLNVSGNEKILKFVNIPSTVRGLNASFTGISTINDLTSDNSKYRDD